MSYDLDELESFIDPEGLNETFTQEEQRKYFSNSVKEEPSENVKLKFTYVYDKTTDSVEIYKK